MASFTAFSGSQLSCRATAAPRVSRSSVIVRAATAVPPQFKGVKPVGDRVFVKVDKEEAKTSGGVLLPANARNKPTAGAVVAAGDVNAVNVGDRVVYSKYAGTDVTVSGENHVLLKEEDVIGQLNGEDIAKLKPLGDRVLIKVAEKESKSAGGVLLTNESADKPTFGVVISVGPGKKKEDSDALVPPNVAVGATVMYSKYSGTEFQGANDEEYIVVREADILAQLA